MLLSFVNMFGGYFPTPIVKRGIFRKPQLQNKNTLKSYGIEYDSVVVLLNAPNYEINVAPNDTMESLAGILKTKNRIETEEMELIFCGEKLKNDISLNQHSNLQDYSVIFVDLFHIGQVFIKTLTGKSITVDFQRGATVRCIKSRIATLEGIPNYQQRLIFSGRELDDNEILEDCNIKNQCTLHLVLKLRGGHLYHVRMPDGQVISISGCDEKTVEEFKIEIWESVNILPSKQKLLLDGEELQDDKKMYQYGKELILDLIALHENISRDLFISCINGEMLIVKVDIESTTILDLKNMIEKKNNIPVNNQLLFYEKGLG